VRYFVLFVGEQSYNQKLFLASLPTCFKPAAKYYLFLQRTNKIS